MTVNANKIPVENGEFMMIWTQCTNTNNQKTSLNYVEIDKKYDN